MWDFTNMEYLFWYDFVSLRRESNISNNLNVTKWDQQTKQSGRPKKANDKNRLPTGKRINNVAEIHEIVSSWFRHEWRRHQKWFTLIISFIRQKTRSTCWEKMSYCRWQTNWSYILYWRFHYLIFAFDITSPSITNAELAFRNVEFQSKFKKRIFMTFTYGILYLLSTFASCVSPSIALLTQWKFILL